MLLFLYNKSIAQLHMFFKKKKIISTAHVRKDSIRHYINITIGNLQINFHKHALKELRGIGRVSRELYSQLHILKKTTIYKRGNTNKKRVFFYSTIHWCPTILPHPSCILILDVIPLLFPEMFTDISKHWESTLKPIAQQADKILTISHASADDISRLLAIPREKINVISLGVTKLPIAKKRSFKLPSENFIVYLGAIDYHKNIKVILTAMRDSSIRDISLIMIGGNKRAKKLVADMEIIDRVHFLGRLKDDEAGYVISNALALVCPSLFEGFGLPPLEAGLLGVPSICSSRPAMTEVMADAALFAPPDEPDKWVKAIKRLRDDTLFRNKLGIAAKEQAEHFSWQRCSTLLMKNLNELT